MTNTLRLFLAGPLLLALAILWAGCAKEEVEGGTPLHPYPLDRCLVCDQKLGGDSKTETQVFVHDGKEIKLCSEDCRKAFNKDPQLYLAKMPPPIPEGRVEP